MIKFKILIIMLFAFVVTGCGNYNDVEINLAEYKCKKHGGLYAINPVTVGGEVVHCKDNTRHTLEGVIPVEEIDNENN